MAGDPKPQHLLLAFEMLTSRAGSAVSYFDLAREIGCEAARRMVELQVVFYCPPIEGWDGQAPPSVEASLRAPCVPSLAAMKYILDHAAAIVPPAAGVAAADVVPHRGECQNPRQKWTR